MEDVIYKMADILKKRDQEIKQLEQQNKELLEALIEIIKADYIYLKDPYDTYVSIIEKATGKTWEQINEMV